MAVSVIIFFPSVTREVLIQPFASDMQLYLTGKKYFLFIKFTVFTQHMLLANV